MPLPDDAALNARLTHLRQADPAAFLELLFRSFYAPLLTVACRVVPERAVAEDLVQDVFARLWQGLDQLPALDSYRAYLTRAVVNEALQHRRRARPQVAWDEAPPEAATLAAPDALADLHAAETAGAVAAALARLPPQCRVVFELSRYEEMSYGQIAEALDISPKTVENQMGKALRILRRELAVVLKNLYWLLLFLSLGAGAGRPARAAAPGAPGPEPRLTPAGGSYFAGPRGGKVRRAHLVYVPAAHGRPASL